MDSKELRIGNYFIYNTDGCLPNNPIRESKIITVVRQIKEDSVGITHLKTTGIMIGGLGLIKPIPLTEEWLIKFGFEKITNDYISGDFEYSITDCLIDGNMEFVYVCSKDATLESKCQLPKYVHQLQNLYFTLTGEELTIKK